MFSKLVRLGKDAELATTPNGKQVCKIVAAYDVGWGDNKKTVWLDGSLWGDRGAKLAQYLTKGTQIVIHADDVEPDAFQGKNGLQTKLKMTINNIELIARSNDTPKPVQQVTNSSPSYLAPAIDDMGDLPF
jgi:single-strand DNA-binding protein